MSARQYKAAKRAREAKAQRKVLETEPPPRDEVALAQRDRAIELLDRLESAFPPGFSTPDVQATLRETRQFLEFHGRRKSERALWVDRG